MNGHRDTSSRIWRTVVVAGAMLGAPACHHDKPASTMPENTAKPADPATPTPTPTTTADPPTPPSTDPATPAKPPTQAADPCAGQPTPADPPPQPKKRPRGGGDRPTGRGFVLS